MDGFQVEKKVWNHSPDNPLTLEEGGKKRWMVKEREDQWLQGKVR